MSNHKWVRQHISNGDKSIQENCSECNAISYRYRDNRRSYPNNVAPGPCIAATVEPYQITMPVKATVAPVVSINRMTEPEARLKESLVIINLMYEDMVAHSIRTSSRRMAGTFLHSQGYEQMEQHYATH